VVSFRFPSAARCVCPAMSFLGLVIALAGCQQPASGLSRFRSALQELTGDKKTAEADPAKTDDAKPKEAEPVTPVELAKDAWIAATFKQGQQDPEALRWRNPVVDDLLATPRERQPDYAIALDSDKPIVVANAAIALSRLGSGAGIEQLVEAVRSTPLKLPLRRAAAEALSRVPEPSPLALLRELTDEYGKFAPPDDHHYLPELHSELLHGLARHVDAASDPRFTLALTSPAAEVRLVALDAWCKKGTGEAPIAVTDLRSDPDTRVRVAALKALVARQHPSRLEYARAALGDYQFDVRLGAIAALGKIGGDDAEQTLRKLMPREPVLIRAALVAALAEAGAEEDVRLASKDTAWQVRAAVIEGLPASRENSAIVRAALEDRSTEVQRRTIGALEKWPLPSAGSILLLALDKSSYASRKAAAEQLSRRWAPAKAFSIDLPTERRGEVMATLQSKWTQEFGQLDRVELASHTTAAEPASPVQMQQIETLIARLTDVNASREAHEAVVAELQRRGEPLLALLEDAATDDGRVLPEPLYLEVFPKMDAAFESLQRLKSTDVSERRRAAERLSKQTPDEPLRPLAVERLAAIGVLESDPIVWRSLMTTIHEDSREPARRLAHAALSHPSSEVRRLACDYLALHPNKADVPALLPALAEKDTSVVDGAVRALGQPGMLDDPRPLEKLLTTPDKGLRLQVALGLAQLQAPSGPNALELLARDIDPDIRRQTAVAMGQLADRQFTATLISLLDDSLLGVRRAALASLPQVVGQDIVAKQLPAERDESTLNMVEKIDLWKDWWKAQQ
jgi:HEAT repeat protein